MINLHDKKSKGTHWVLLIIDGNVAVYFDSFGIEYIPLEVLNKIRDKSTTRNICIEYMLLGKPLLDYNNLFSPNDYERSDKIIYNYFKDKYGRRSKFGV